MIGIIGGAGVAAGAALVARIEEIVTASGAYLDQQHPEVVLYQATQAPSRSMHLEGRGDSFIPAYRDATRRLADFGATCIAMCCNTAHAALDELQAASSVPFINLIEETLAELGRRHPDATRVGILCSDGTRAARLYDRQLARQERNLQLVYPDELHQKRVTQGIRNIKRGLHRGPASPERPQELFAAAADHLAGLDVEAILLACTEIPLALNPALWSGPPLIDTIDVLAHACLRSERKVAP
jgi:aspartate racemase